MAKVIEDYVNLSDLHISELPEFLKDVQIRSSGKSYYQPSGLNISRNKLTSFKNCPSFIAGDFFAKNCNLTSLIGGPNYVGGNFMCNRNKLTSLEGIPKRIFGDFICRGNPVIFPEKEIRSMSQIQGKIVQSEY